VLRLAFAEGRIAHMDLIADPATLEKLDLAAFGE
jgi:hypothetical protein